jgi:hypothetical protein
MPFSLHGRNLKKNDSGDDVKELQRALYLLNYDIGDFGPNKDGIDGSFGTLTENAVIDFQSTHFNIGSQALQVDGVVGSGTEGSLNKILENESLFIDELGSIKYAIFFPALLIGLPIVVRGEEYRIKVITDGFRL